MAYKAQEGQPRIIGGFPERLQKKVSEVGHQLLGSIWPTASGFQRNVLESCELGNPNVIICASVHGVQITCTLSLPAVICSKITHASWLLRLREI